MKTERARRARPATGKEDTMANEKKKRLPVNSRCEDCEFYRYDEWDDAYVCDQRLDEDEMAEFLAKRTGTCPYYRYYNEYKSVQTQI